MGVFQPGVFQLATFSGGLSVGGFQPTVFQLVVFRPAVFQLAVAVFQLAKDNADCFPTGLPGPLASVARPRRAVK